MKNVCRLVFKLNADDIKEVNSVKYLGHIVCIDSKDDKDIMRQCHQLYARGNVLLRKCYTCTNVIRAQMMSRSSYLLFPFCSFMYTAQLWWNHTVYIIHRLHVCYNNIVYVNIHSTHTLHSTYYYYIVHTEYIDYKCIFFA